MARPLADIPNDDQQNAVTNTGWVHAIPFVAWLILMPMLDFSPAWMYALRALLCAGLFLYCAPWRWYTPLRVRNLPLAFGVGVLVCVIWVAPEARWTAEHLPGFYHGYLRLGIMPPWSLFELPVDSPYDPAVCGWGLASARLLGSSVVVPPLEEFFWRAFLYRWLMQTNFLKVDLGRFHAKSFLIMILFFGFEHHRWFVGILAGAFYGWMLIRTKDVWAVSVAHGITNLLLGLYVLQEGAWGFW